MKTQLKIAINFISPLDNDQQHIMHSKSDNIETMMNDEADDAIKKFFDSLKSRYHRYHRHI